MYVWRLDQILPLASLNDTGTFNQGILQRVIHEEKVRIMGQHVDE